MPLWLAALVAQLDKVILILIGAPLGLSLASRIGLGLPLVEGWTTKGVSRAEVRLSLGMGLAAGIVVGLAILGLSVFVFGPALETLLDDMGLILPADVKPPAWQGLLAAVSAGINEEILFRLFGVTLLSWLGSLLFKTEEGRPPLAVLWFATVVVAGVFGLAHLPATSMMGLPLTPMVIARAIVLNGIGGMVFGWLYWQLGLESAMMAHFSTDVVLYFLAVLAFGREMAAVTVAIFGGGIVLMALGAWLLLRRHPEPMGAM
jgi:hypothetical protein